MPRSCPPGSRGSPQLGRRASGQMLAADAPYIWRLCRPTLTQAHNPSPALQALSRAGPLLAHLGGGRGLASALVACCALCHGCGEEAMAPWWHDLGLPCAQAAAPSTVFMPRVCSGSASRVPSPCGWAGTSRSPRSSSRCCSTCMKWHLARVIRGPGGTCMLLARQASLTPLKPYNTRGRLPSAPLYPPQEPCEGEPELMTEEAILDWASSAAAAPASSAARQCHDRSLSLLAWLRSDD